jgi:glycosyltransferase involved in cell wall biosynthesis
MRKKQKTLVILTPGFPASEDDSTCLPMQQALTRALHVQFPEVEVNVISFQYPYKESIYSCAGATVHSFGNRNRGHLFTYILRNKILSRLQAIKKNETIIGLFSFWYGECAAVGNIFAGKNSFDHYCWLSGQDARPGNKHPNRVRLRPENLIALSDSIRKEFKKNYGVLPSRVITPGVDLKGLNFIQKERDIDILGVGSLIPLKQFDIFLEIVSGIKTLIPGLKCIIVGEGPEKEKLQEKIMQLGMQAHVFLLGEIPHSRVLECMSRTKVLLHTSSYEGFSGVCMEAISMGAFVLSFTRPMDHDIDQWHVAENPMDMIRKLSALLKRKDQKPVRDFPIENTAWQIMELFGECPGALEKPLQLSARG